MPNALVPEVAVSSWEVPRRFYCNILGFRVLYERPEEAFSYFSLGGADIMIDQIGAGRTFDGKHLPDSHPFGKDLNVQIRVDRIDPLLSALEKHKIRLFLPVEERWCRKEALEVGNRQFVVADPDGYLLRFYQDLSSRSRAEG